MTGPTDFTYSSAGAEVPARLYLPPPASAPAAGVLLCAGRFRDIEGLAFLSEALAAAGYVVAATRYRGMDLFTDDEDVIAGLDHLAGLPQVDPARLGLVGHSRGGNAALRAAGQDARVRTVVALAPPIDFARYMRAMELLSPVRYQALLGAMGGPPGEQPERYHRLSALSYADRIKVPVLLLCGTQDLHAPLDHSQWMLAALQEAGNTRSRLEPLDGLGHFFERMYFGYQFDLVAGRVLAWLRETLPA
jgi:dipeptidyl aminopeptidase/acylaminoacyl peptidase